MSSIIPYLNQKIWYAFQGLPIERITGCDCLPWSKCLVLTNNLMYILQFNQLTASFKKYIDKDLADENKGVTFDEYQQFLDNYVKDQNQIFKTESKDRNSNEISGTSASPEVNKRLRGNTSESFPGNNKSATLNLNMKSHADTSSSIKTFNDYCWTLFRTKHFPQINNNSDLHNAFFNLWLIFITFAMKNSETGVIFIPVKMDLLEAKYWCSRIRELLGLRRQNDEGEIEENIASLDYNEFYAMFSDIFKSTSLSNIIIAGAVQELADEALEGVIMKGVIKVDKYVRYCVLKSSILMIYNNKVSALNFRNCFVLSGDSEIKTGNNKILLRSPGMTFVTTVTIEVSETQLFNKWCSAFSDAIQYAKSNVTNPAIKEANLREEIRQVKRSNLRNNRINMEQKLEEERKERLKVTEAMQLQLKLADQKIDVFKQQIEKELSEKELLMKENEDIRQETDAHIKEVISEQHEQYELQHQKLKEIEMEKECLNEKLLETLEEKTNEELKRTLLEEKHLEAQQMLLEAEQKINSLEKLGEQLEKALEEEKQAKEDEERIRTATLLLLEEEHRSKEKLEALLHQQSDMIDQEILKRNEFAQELEREKCRIQEIAEEKEKLTKELENNRLIMQSTGNRVRKLDTKVLQIAENIYGKEDARLPVSHRGKGFIAEIIVKSKLKKMVVGTENTENTDINHDK